MRRFVSFAVAALVGAGGAATTQAGGINFGVTITGQVVPGVYGHVVIGNVRPPVVYARPTVIVPPAPGVVVQPIYLHVPPEHARHWREHCREYHACNRPVYFVRSAEYAPGFSMERWRREHPARGHREHARDDHDRGHWDHDHDRHDHDDHDKRHGRDRDDRD